MARTEHRIPCGSTDLAAWMYAPNAPNGDSPCVVMAHGFSLTRHDGLDGHARAFADAGCAALVIDHRYLGDSGGEPRQRFRRRAQIEDLRSAVAYARRLPGVDPGRIVVYGFSFAGGNAVAVAASDQDLAGAILICPLLDGLARVIRTPPRLAAWLLPRAALDLAGRHITVPVTAAPGQHGAMTLPGEEAGFAAAVPDGSPWRNEISPAIFASVAFVRPVRAARKVSAPVFLALGERDMTVSAKAIERFARVAPRAELHRYDADHFELYHADVADQMVNDAVGFLDRTVLAPR